MSSTEIYFRNGDGGKIQQPDIEAMAASLA
jgi:hypothetical protein